MKKYAATADFQDIDWSTWEPCERATLLFVVREGRILLIHKKRGLGAGYINGPGGRIEPGETPEDAAIREVKEEVRVTATGISRSGELFFQFFDGFSIHVTVFRARGLVGEPGETDEAAPFRVPVDEIPYGKMWPDDIIWLPLFLEDTPFKGYFLFDGSTILGHEIGR